MTDPDFLVEVLTIFAKADSHDTLLWWAKPDGIELWANVSDVFDWGSADAEAITPDRLPILRQALADLTEADATGWIAELYAARIRGMRPQGAAYPTNHAAQRLLNACGPDRPRDLLNPKSISIAASPCMCGYPDDEDVHHPTDGSDCRGISNEPVRDWVADLAKDLKQP